MVEAAGRGPPGIGTAIGLPHVPGHRDHRLPLERGTLEKAQQLANHESARTTKLYDRGTTPSRSTRWRGSRFDSRTATEWLGRVRRGAAVPTILSAIVARQVRHRLSRVAAAGSFSTTRRSVEDSGETSPKPFSPARVLPTSLPARGPRLPVAPARPMRHTASHPTRPFHTQRRGHDRDQSTVDREGMPPPGHEGRRGGSGVPEKAAMVMMGAMVVASVGGVVLQLWKELRKKDGHDHDPGPLRQPAARRLRSTTWMSCRLGPVARRHRGRSVIAPGGGDRSGELNEWASVVGAAGLRLSADVFLPASPHLRAHPSSWSAHPKCDPRRG